MKKAINTVSSFLSRITAAALVWIGLGCSSDSSDNENFAPEPCMYGAPIGTFEVKGSVTTANNASKRPVAAKVIVTAPGVPSSSYNNYGMEETSGSGRYAIGGQTNDDDIKLKVVCLPKDPSLEPDSVVVDAKFAKVSSDRGYFIDLGHADVKVDFKLKKKKKSKNKTSNPVKNRFFKNKPKKNR